MADSTSVESVALIEAPVALAEAPPAPPLPPPETEPAPKPPSRSKHVRFDATSPVFLSLADAYAAAVHRADRLHESLERAEAAGRITRAEGIAQKLAVAEEELDAARAALQAHVRATLRHEVRSRMKRWSLRHERLRVSAVA